MEPPISPVLFSILFFLGMLTMLEVGRRLAVRRRSKEVDGERSNLGPIEGAVFALFGLLMAFTFSGAASRFNEKRMLIAEEANTVETAYLRLHLVPDAEPKLQNLFRQYLDSRLETYRKMPNMKAASLEMGNSKRIQEEIWTEAVAATRLPSSHPAAGWLLLPALNNMIDITTTRTMALQMHPPRIIYALLFGPGSYLLAPGGLSDGDRAAPELVAHSRFHSDYSDCCLRCPRHRVSACRPYPPGGC